MFHAEVFERLVKKHPEAVMVRAGDGASVAGVVRRQGVRARGDGAIHAEAVVFYAGAAARLGGVSGAEFGACQHSSDGRRIVRELQER